MPDIVTGAPCAEKRKQWLIDHHIVNNGVTDPQVLEALVDVPRAHFIPEELQHFLYEDIPLPTASGQTLYAPHVIATLMQALKLEGGERVLEIGTGSGYLAALISRVANEVTTVDRQPALSREADARYRRLGYDNIHIHTADGSKGWPGRAPYDAIVVTAAAPRVPETLRAQLKVGGRLVIAVGARSWRQQLLQEHRKSPGQRVRHRLRNVHFVPLIGQEGWPDAAPL